MKSNTTISYWLGDDASLQTFLDASEQMKGTLPAEDYELPRIMEIEDGIAVISIKGSLTSVDNWWNSFMGITSYNEIRNAIVLAVNDESVTRIMLDIDSGGGHASGVAELAEFIKKAIDHKPIDAYVSGTAFSAAYWIASAASTISGTKMAEAGSIGVIAIVQTYEKVLKDRKISTHVFRGGVHKALGNGYEALTGEAKELIQTKIDTMYGFFLEAIVENRPVILSASKTWAEGNTFFFQDAIDLQLVDKVATFDEVFIILVKASSNTNHMRLEDNAMKMTLKHTEASIAAKAAGASEDEINKLMEQVAAGDDVDPKAEGDDVDPKAEGDDVDPKAEGDDVDSKAEGDDVDPKAEGEEAEASESDQLVTFLKGENKTLTLENAKLVAASEQAETKLTTLEADTVSLKEIAGTAMASMCVALGQTAPGETKNMDTSVVLQQYIDIRAKFIETFRVGGKAEVKDDDPEAQADGGMSHLDRASRDANNI